jgi:hypothetical protein
MEQFTYESKDILDRLYQETPIGESSTYEDFLKLPLNEEYIKNQEKKKKDQELKSNIPLNNDQQQHKQQ